MAKYKKTIRRKKAPSYITGDFRKFNPKKYKGDLSKPIRYRSGYELRFMHQLENNKNVEWWNFENIIIPYIYEARNGERKRHNYIMDFQVKMKNSGLYLCEVKPANKVPLNESQINKTPDHRRNAFKWKAAIKWCQLNNHQFKIITEKDLNI